MEKLSKVQRLLDFFAALRTEADAGAVLGEPVTVEGRTVIPVAEVSYCVSAGVECPADEQPAARSFPGRKGGSHTRPLAAIEVTASGVRVRPIVDAQQIARMRLLLIAWAALWLFVALYLIFGRHN